MLDASMRSLVFLIFIIAAHLTDTLARYNHIKLRHGRHRRGHGDGYLPKIFILDTEEPETGSWGPWSGVSLCSRTCGGGVAHQIRQCLDKDDNGADLCTGAKKRFFSCNLHECPEGSKDFRAEQCASYNNVAIDGIYYDWIPYTGGSNKCELNCMPRGERFFYRHNESVIDGTPCVLEKNDVCVEGKCMHVGCDLMLGSNAKEDACRECGGNGTDCFTVKESVNKDDFQVGYNDILLIPAGATNIVIREVSASNNYLAIRNSTGDYYLNGNWRIDFPRSLRFAGTIFHYERKAQGYAAPDKITALGPTNEAIYVVLLYQGTNVGVDYEYSIPKRFSRPNDTYTWIPDEFSKCSTSCGGGYKSRKVSCVRRRDFQAADDSLCDAQLEPDDTETCSEEPCPPEWVESGWGPCSKECGEGGEQTREIKCEQVISGGIAAIVDDSQCIDRLGPKASIKQKCNEDVDCPQWHTGPWKPCDHLCGEGKQTRKVTCFRKVNGKIEPLDDSACKDEIPEREKRCELGPCAGLDWIVSDWSGCDGTCGLTRETRTAQCASLDGTVYPEEKCDPERKPELARDCTNNPGNCDFQWYATQWSKCSAKCGSGLRTRTVFCGTFSSNGTCLQKVPDSKCEPENKYNDTKNCTAEVEKCEGEWFAGRWSKCSKPCDSGDMTRTVICMKDNQKVPITNCDHKNILFDTQPCNTKVCQGEFLPVDPEKMIPDDEDDDCLVYENADFVTFDPSLDVQDNDSNEQSNFSPNIPPVEPSYTSSDTSTDDWMLSDSPYTESGSGSGDGVSTLFGESSTTNFDHYTSSLEGSGSGPDTSTTFSGDGSSDSTVSSIFEVTESEETLETEESTGSSDETSAGTPEISDSEETGESTESTISTEVSGITEQSTGSSISESESTDETSTGTTETSDSEQTGESTESDISTEVSGFTEQSTGSSISESESTNESSAGNTETSVSEETGEPTESSITTEVSGLTEESTGSSISESESTIESSALTTETSVSEETGEPTESSITTEVSGFTEQSTGSSISESESTNESSALPDETSSSTESSITTEVSGITEGSTAESSATEVTESAASTVPDETTTSGVSTVSIEATESVATNEATQAEVSSVSGVTTESGTSSAFGKTDVTAESEITTEITTEAESITVTTGQSHITDIWTIEITTRDRKCLVRKTCKNSEFGCCYDGVKPATGPFRKGCPIPETCKDTEFGCCPDGVSPKTGSANEGCPDSHCNETLFGCCQDGVTAAEGNDFEGCKQSCNETEFGCCPDGKTPAADNNNLGCCNVTTYGCCPDGINPASGKNGEGCEEMMTSSVSPSEETTEVTSVSPSEETTEVTSVSPTEEEGSLTDATTIGPEEEVETVHCSNSTFGCCPDGEKTATGINFEGCAVIDTENCTLSHFGCCSDGKTAALGSDNAGCPMPCAESAYGCCDDESTPAHGPNKEGCCLSSPYGCCPDNIMQAQAPNLYGCGCQYSRYHCCPDNTTAARGPNNEGCGCEHSSHGCCPNRITPATGPNFEGCPCYTYQFGCCPDGITIAKGLQKQGCGCENTEFKCCPDSKTPAKGPNYAGCTCDVSKYGCCPDGVEEAQGENFEGCLTVPATPGAACALNRTQGPCRDWTVKWYFNTERGYCDRFWYGGCEGNDNRFKNQEECKYVCEQPKGRDACFLPRSEGSGNDYILTWYYDAERKQCGQFAYRGSFGNANNFVSREACEDLCVLPQNTDACDQAKETGPCQGNFTRWYFNKMEQRCEQFEYGGCKANDNNFRTEVACHQQCLQPTRRRVIWDVCALEKESGPCPGSLLRWYYDAKHQTCRQFVYGGCKGNGNKFRTRTACEQRCPARDSCSLPRAEGNCTENLARWYFDQTEDRCMPFYYTGCPGNTNNFETRDACEADCPPKIVQDICIQPALLGECYNWTMRWYYDSYEQRCTQFYYGGCGGNENNFQSKHDCINRCESAVSTPSVPDAPIFKTEFCFLPDDHGPCTDEVPSWFYDSREGICKQFSYGGCQGNGNRFPTREDCEYRCGTVQDLCTLPQVAGPCGGSERQYYYDRRTDSCHEFDYGGCQGNGNRFKDRKSCEERCKEMTNVVTEAEHKPTPATSRPDSAPASIPSGSICMAPADAGPCAGNITAYFYDDQFKSCQAFIYGGCQGNDNRFQTEEECERRCGKFQGQDYCNLPVDKGPCHGEFPKFFYDPEIRGCREFRYGGCDGNANRFSSVSECESICLDHEKPEPVTEHPDSCNLPHDSGPCRKHFDRYFYDPAIKACRPFVYGGCGGNANRFNSASECESVCLHHAANILYEDTTPKPKDPCFEANEECDNMRCTYGKEAFVDRENCKRCRCADPCRSANCPEGAKCIINLVARHNTTEYQAVCRSPVKPGECPTFSGTSCDQQCISDADCSKNRKCCAHSCGTSCQDPRPPEPPTDTTPKPKDPCFEANEECDNMRCPYGKEEFVDRENCKRCRCADPCRSANCPEGAKCIITLVARHNTTEYQAACRSPVKPGECPTFSGTTCDQQCISDADCSENRKCCAHSCGTSCQDPRPPEPPTTLAPVVTTPQHFVDPPTIEQPKEPEIRVGEGGYVNMSCVATGGPQTFITWRKGAIPIDTSVSRYRILMDGSLQIINLYRSDAGIYICTADNHVAQVTIEYRLTITDPHEHATSIIAEPNSYVTANFNSPTSLHCYAVGWPRPTIFWWLDNRFIELDSQDYEYQRDNSLLIRNVTLSNLGVYTCQAFNGVGRASSWSVTLQAYGPVSAYVRPEMQQYMRYVVPRYRSGFPQVPESVRQTNAPLFPPIQRKPNIPTVAPEIPSRFKVPVKVNVSVQQNEFKEGSEISIACNVDGYPDPRVVWFKDDETIEPSSRIKISEANRLIISDANKNDSGKYRCEASNKWDTDSGSVEIQIAGTYIHPDCQDNLFFANCRLIVKSHFCQHEHYGRFCCRSCTEAGQLPVRRPHINETRRRRSIPSLKTFF